MKYKFAVFLTSLLSCLSLVAAQPLRSTNRESGKSSKRLQIFIQDIISVGIDHDFQNGRIRNHDLIRFGIYQIALRRHQFFQNVGSSSQVRVAASHVSAVITQYFGKTLHHQSIDNWKYRNGFYYGYDENFEQLDIETIKHRQFYTGGKGEITAYVDYVDSMATADADREIIIKTKMFLQEVSSKSGKHYILRSYRRLSANKPRKQ